MNDRLKIAISLPYLFSVRDFLFTPVWEEMAKRNEAHFFLLCRSVEVNKLVSQRTCSNITFLEFPPLSNNGQKSRAKKILRWSLKGQIWPRLLRRFDVSYINKTLMYRFAALNDLSHYRIRRGKSRQERRRQQVFYDYGGGEAVGFPFPKSRVIFRLLYKLRGFLNFAVKDEIVLLQNLKPDLFVFGRLHLHSTAYWARHLRRLVIPMIGIVSSWDHPTTKGATPRGMSGYIVASRRMVEEMSALHGVQRAKIYQVGKVQMDVYMNRSTCSRREDFLKGLGIPSGHRLVIFGTNTTGLKEHEVSIAQKLAKDFINGRYGKATLLLRTHPQDVNWERDFLSLARPPSVICMDASSFGSRATDSILHGRDDLVFLANLMKHSDVAIQSRGSLALDAIAFDTPVISLAFDGDLERTAKDSFLMEYGFEHYKPLVAAEGTWMVGSYEALDQAIREYLRDPAIHREGRRLIRDEHIEPLDGKASQRLVDYLVESAKKAREGTLPEGDWGHTGLGDVTWASRQTCDVRDYVQE